MIEDAGIADEDVERAWRLTRAAYDDPEFEGLEIDDTRAIIDISGRHVHVAFRGTATPLNAAHDVAFLLLPLSDFLVLSTRCGVFVMHPSSLSKYSLNLK